MKYCKVTDDLHGLGWPSFRVSPPVTDAALTGVQRASAEQGLRRRFLGHIPRTLRTGLVTSVHTLAPTFPSTHAATVDVET